MKIANIDREIFISSERLRNFREIFRKNVTYDNNIKSHKLRGFHPLFIIYIFGKPLWGVGK